MSEKKEWPYNKKGIPLKRLNYFNKWRALSLDNKWCDEELLWRRHIEKVWNTLQERKADDDDSARKLRGKENEAIQTIDKTTETKQQKEVKTVTRSILV